ncbi:MAG: sigma-54 dependent transcriptional regulator [Tannerellaceae bacterium]|nr:sigma-54 dependent transcriptional regulator [Tannerellaceae bacterium]
MAEKPLILICDDDVTIRTTLSMVLKRAGYLVAAVATREETIQFVRTSTPHLLLMDMNYSQTTTGEEGLQLLKQVKVFCPAVPVILITAWGSIDLAVQGMRAGAFDFITKPWNNLALLKNIETAIRLHTDKIEMELQFPSIIGRSPLLLQALDTVKRIAGTQAPVLITGESGTGKELVAEAIHENSSRKTTPFVKVNLGGISQSLFESEMFGHKKGAFTDALYDRTGRFEMADKGTIFLDEIGELDLVCQVKLLRVLQDQTFEPLGESRSRQIDTRIICATNKSLPEMVAQGTFREDLYYRINLITIRIPALRERPEDIPLLVNHFITQQATLLREEKAEITPEAMDFLQNLPYPGNIRELKNLVERTLLISGNKRLTEKDFQAQYTETPQISGRGGARLKTLETVEREMIHQAISLYGNNHSKIAHVLGISRQALYRRLEKYKIHLPG